MIRWGFLLNWLSTGFEGSLSLSKEAVWDRAGAVTAFPKGLQPLLLWTSSCCVGNTEDDHQASSKSGTFYQKTGCTDVSSIFLFVVFIYIQIFPPTLHLCFFSTSFCKAASQMSKDKVLWSQASCAHSLPCCLWRLWLQTERLSSSCGGCMAHRT